MKQQIKIEEINREQYSQSFQKLMNNALRAIKRPVKKINLLGGIDKTYLEIFSQEPHLKISNMLKNKLSFLPQIRKSKGKTSLQSRQSSKCLRKSVPLPSKKHQEASYKNEFPHKKPFQQNHSQLRLSQSVQIVGLTKQKLTKNKLNSIMKSRQYTSLIYDCNNTLKYNQSQEAIGPWNTSEQFK